jgi:preprotein translocase subunit SecA
MGDPLVQYKTKASGLFQELLSNMRLGVITRMFTYRPRDLSGLQLIVRRREDAELTEPRPEGVAEEKTEAVAADREEKASSDGESKSSKKDGAQREKVSAAKKREAADLSKSARRRRGRR